MCESACVCERESPPVCVCVCVFSLRRLIGELTCRYPLKGISLASLLPYKQRNKASVTPASTPGRQGGREGGWWGVGGPGRLWLCAGGAKKKKKKKRRRRRGDPRS